VSSLNEALDQARQHKIPAAFIIGGSAVYEEAIKHPDLQTLYVTQVETKVECDRFFPPLPARFTLQSESETLEENGVSFKFQVWT
jgi:dihydrofolate reductase